MSVNRGTDTNCRHRIKLLCVSSDILQKSQFLTVPPKSTRDILAKYSYTSAPMIANKPYFTISSFAVGGLPSSICLHDDSMEFKALLGAPSNAWGGLWSVVISYCLVYIGGAYANKRCTDWLNSLMAC
jgi:hypothetical protein